MKMCKCDHTNETSTLCYCKCHKRTMLTATNGLDRNEFQKTVGSGSKR